MTDAAGHSYVSISCLSISQKTTVITYGKCFNANFMVYVTESCMSKLSQKQMKKALRCDANTARWL